MHLQGRCLKIGIERASRDAGLLSDLPGAVNPELPILNETYANFVAPRPFKKRSVVERKTWNAVVVS